jgi:Protein of unknown function (DUF3618)
MGERTDQIEREIEETRNELGENFSELERKVKSAVDWRNQFEERPGTMLALAFGGGIILSAILPSVRRSRRNYDDGAKPITDRDYSGSAFQSSSRPAGKPSETRQTVEALTGALVGVAVNRVSGFIDSLLPGFEHEFSKAKSAKTSYAYRPDSASNAEINWPPKSTAVGAD